MNICLLMPPDRAQWFANIGRLFVLSLRDLGHNPLASIEQAELCIAIQQWPPDMVRRPGCKYILLQTEQPGHELAQSIAADQTWGFMPYSPGMIYIYLGYHPCLEVSGQPRDATHKLGFIGTMTPRRTRFFERNRHQPAIFTGFDWAAKVSAARSCSVNLNLHAFGPTQYTEWDRISLFLANRCPFISERFYCPLSGVIQFDEADYDETVGLISSMPAAATALAETLYQLYREKYDHRNQLMGLLEAL